MKLGILASHPVQYIAPLFRELATRCDLEVFYAFRPTPSQQGREGFGIPFQWDVDLLAGYPHRFLANRSADPSTSRFNGCDTPEIRTHIANGRFDAFLVSGWNLRSYWQAILMCRRLGIRLLVRGDSQLPRHNKGMKSIAKEAIYPLGLRAFDAFCSVGKRNREYLIHYGVPGERIFFSPHAVDDGLFGAPVPGAEVSGVRAEMDIPAGAKVVLYVGKLTAKKRVGDFIDGLAHLKDAGTALCGLVVGTGPNEQMLRERAHSAGVDVKFVGFRNQTEMPRIYSAVDALVLPSDDKETWGMVVNEAFACGTPAVVSDAVGCSDDLIADDTGAIYPMGNTLALANAIRVLLRKGKGPDVAAALKKKCTTYSLGRAVEGILRAATAA